MTAQYSALVSQQLFIRLHVNLLCSSALYVVWWIVLLLVVVMLMLSLTLLQTSALPWDDSKPHKLHVYKWPTVHERSFTDQSADNSFISRSIDIDAYWSSLKALCSFLSSGQRWELWFHGVGVSVGGVNPSVPRDGWFPRASGAGSLSRYLLL